MEREEELAEAEARAFDAVRSPDVTEGELSLLAACPTPEVRLAVAAHARTPGEALRQLAADEDARVVEAVARNPHTPPAVLDEMADDNPWVAANPATPAATIERLARGEATGQYFVALSTGEAHLLASLAGDADKTVRAAVAGNAATSPATLEVLASDAVARVRAGVAANARATAEALATLAGADNETVYDEVLREAAGLDAFGTIHELVVRHPAVTPEILEALARSTNVSVRARVAEHPRTPRRALSWLCRDSYPIVKTAARANPSRPWWSGLF
jgi:hypothetical protein